MPAIPRNVALWWQFTLRQVELRHKGSHLGLIWSIFNPLLMLGLYVFVFGYVFQGSFHVLAKETPVDYALAVFVGLSLYHFVAEVIGLSTGVVPGNPNFVKKVVFPLEVLPASVVGAAFIHHLISVILVLIGVALLGPGLTWSALWWPIVVTPVLLFSLGMAWLLGSLGVFNRDLNQITGFITAALLFSSAVFYPVHKVPAEAWKYLRLNPLIHAIELTRDVVLWNKPISWGPLLYLYLIGTLAFVVGWTVFRRLKPIFADVL